MVNETADREQTVSKAPEVKYPAPDRSEKQNLDEDFYRRLTDQPLCKRTGECDGCGRCEH